MKQLGVMNFASLTEKSSKIQRKAVSQNQRKYMAKKYAISEGQSFFYNPNYPVNFPCGWKPEYPEKTHSFWQSVD